MKFALIVRPDQHQPLVLEYVYVPINKQYGQITPTHANVKQIITVRQELV